MSADIPSLSTEKWSRIRDIYARVLEAPAEEQAALVEQLCCGDSQIESELKGLLSAHGRIGSFLNDNASLVMKDFAGLAPAALNTGTVLASRFHILQHIDSGGMGSVYEAWDSELQEIVALKTIRPDIASDPSVIERFKEEVRQAHQITHPNICRVNDLFSHDFSAKNRIWFLTMQMLKGETLLQRLRRDGPLSPRRALPLLKQVIAGLAEAHRHGIVHRDFKSSNVMLVNEEPLRAVVTDFGLASQASAGGVDARLAGQGTPAYAAPEQWFDGVASPASDQYSLGVVMCEMLTGERPTPVTRDGDSCLPARLPRTSRLEKSWEAAIRRCVEVCPENRFRALDDILKGVDPVRRRRVILGWAAALVAALFLFVVGMLFNRELHRLPTLIDQRRITPEGDLLSEGPRLSRDGKTLVYVSDQERDSALDVFVYPLPNGPARRITKEAAINERPTISPDGRLVAFESTRNPPGIYLAEASTGTLKRIASDGHEPSFSPDGHSILYWTGGDEFFVTVNRRIFLYEFGKDIWSGVSRQLAMGMADARVPVWNSDGRHILFTGCGAGETRPYPDCRDWWVTTSDGDAPRATGVAAVLAAQGLMPGEYMGGWQDETVVFSARHHSPVVGLWEIKVNPRTARVEGQARQLIRGDNRDFIISSSLAGDVLATSQWHPAIHIRKIDRPGSHDQEESRVTNHPEFDLGPSVSHNGQWLIFTRGFSDARRIHLLDTTSGEETELPFEEAGINSPLVDDTGRRVAFEASDGKALAIWIGSKDGKSEKLCTGCRNPTGWINDSKILYGDPNLSEIRLRDIQDRKGRTILQFSDGSVQDAVWSPESGYLVFTRLMKVNDGNNRRTAMQIFAARFPPGQEMPDSDWIEITGVSEISRKPAWSGDGKTIYFLSQRDGNWCLWAQRFDPVNGHINGKAFPVRHYHNPRDTPGSINASGLNLSVAGDTVYLNVLETTGTIYVGRLAQPGFFSRDE